MVKKLGNNLDKYINKGIMRIPPFANIKNVNLRYYPEVVELYCRRNNIYKLTCGRNLKCLKCSNNNLTELICNDNLITLSCHKNLLRDLICNDKLKKLSCYNNPLINLIYNKSYTRMYRDFDDLSSFAEVLKYHFSEYISKTPDTHSRLK